MIYAIPPLYILNLPFVLVTATPEGTIRAFQLYEVRMLSCEDSLLSPTAYRYSRYPAKLSPTVRLLVRAAVFSPPTVVNIPLGQTHRRPISSFIQVGEAALIDRFPLQLQGGERFVCVRSFILPIPPCATPLLI